MNTKESIERAAACMEEWARDDSHGYDQQFRWGEHGDYDCSSAVITAWEAAGVPVKAAGAGYTGNMRGAFLRCGFEDVTESVDTESGAGLQRGDVLLNCLHHTAMYCGDGREVEASINECGGTTGGQPGDQTGREFLIRPYRNYPWDCVLRYRGQPAGSRMLRIEAPLLREGSCSAAVAACQAALRRHGFEPGWIDGEFGARTARALRDFQRAKELETDGICGEESWNALLKG